MRTQVYKQFDQCLTTVGKDGDVRTCLALDVGDTRSRRTMVDSIQLLFEIPHGVWEPEILQKNAWLDGFNFSQRQLFYDRALQDTNSEDAFKHAIGESWRKAQASQVMQLFVREWIREHGLDAIRKDARSRVLGVMWCTEIGRREMKPNDPRAEPMLLPVTGRNHRRDLLNLQMGPPSLPEELQLCFGATAEGRLWDHGRIQQHLLQTDFVRRLICDHMLLSRDAMSYGRTVSS
jgi:hypothetical protein